MRTIKWQEQKKRGCAYCNDMRITKGKYDRQHTSCPHDSCPHKVLDKYETYDEFMESEDSKIDVSVFMEEAANCYTLAQPRDHQKKWHFSKNWYL